MIPQPKYQIGERVWRAATTYIRQTKPCPDCLTTCKWHVITPAGEEFEVRCSTCLDGIVDGQSKIVGVVEQLTIGSVRVDTYYHKAPISYMCIETGVGTGTLYEEGYLYTSQEAAQAAADAMAVKASKPKEEIVKSKLRIYKPRR